MWVVTWVTPQKRTCQVAHCTCRCENDRCPSRTADRAAAANARYSAPQFRTALKEAYSYPTSCCSISRRNSVKLLNIRFGTNDLAKARAFYDATFGALGVAPTPMPANYPIAMYKLPGGNNFSIG